MLYRFKSAASGEVLMLEEHAQKIFTILARPLEARGVIAVDDLPQAMQKLDAAMQFSHKQTKALPTDALDHADESGPTVPLHVRALPFYKLLEVSNQAGENMYWGF